MRRLTIIVLISILAATGIISLAFFYIELNVHREFEYNIMSGDEVLGNVKVDRYATENKIILKSRTDIYKTMGYPAKEVKIFLDKKNKLPEEYIEESIGVDFQKRTVMFMRDADEMDFLFLEPPVFFTWDKFRSGDDQLILSADDLTSIVAIFEKYDFWAKGTQFFDVLIPVYAPLPPLREKAELRYIKGNIYVNIMGKKVEAEKIVIKTESLPELEVVVSKYSHRILSFNMAGSSNKFILVSSLEDPHKKIQHIVKKSLRVIKNIVVKSDMPSGNKVIDSRKAEKKESTSGEAVTEVKIPRGIIDKKMFFRSGEAVFPGRLWIPEGEGQFPGVLIIPDSGPIRLAEKYLLDSISNFLYKSGIAVFILDSNGRYNAASIEDSVKYLQGHPSVRDKDIILLGYKGGVESVLEAARVNDNVGSCILLGFPSTFGIYEDNGPVSKKTIYSVFKDKGVVKADDGYMDIVTEQVNDYIESVKSSDDRSKFYGLKLPVGVYRDFMVDDPYGNIISCKKPVLVVAGKKMDKASAGLFKRVKSISKEDDNIGINIINKENDLFGIGFDDEGDMVTVADEKVLVTILEWVLANKRYKEKVIPAEISNPDAAEDAGIQGDEKVIPAFTVSDR